MGTNPWTYIFLFVIVGLAGVMLLAYLASAIITRAAASYSEKTLDRFTKEIEDKLPGKNCGECGCENCNFFADALLRRELSVQKCPYASETLEPEVDEIIARLQALMDDPTPPKARRSFFDRIIGE